MNSAPSPASASRDLRPLAGAVSLVAAGDLLALIVLALQVHELTGTGLAVSAPTSLFPAMRCTSMDLALRSLARRR